MLGESEHALIASTIRQQAVEKYLKAYLKNTISNRTKPMTYYSYLAGVKNTMNNFLQHLADEPFPPSISHVPSNIPPVNWQVNIYILSFGLVSRLSDEFPAKTAGRG